VETGLLVALALAVLIGVSLGLLGSGGSILTIPVLVFVARVPVTESIVTSLAIVGAASAAAAVLHARRGRLVPRAEAKISVFDSAVQGGDAVWEGLRVYDGRIAAFTAHLERLRASAHALAFADIPSETAIRRAVSETLAANGMTDGAHIRLTLTRGEKVTSGMNPRFNRSGPCLIVLAEWKAPVYGNDGVRLVTASVRRNNPQCLDSKIHHNNLLNNILACIEANVAGADAALMLDLAGFVSETNDTNVFAVRGRKVWTPHADSCLPGITRATVLDLCRDDGIPAAERNLSLT
jgi:branched-chain amino acid aminotransferase